MWWNIHYQTWTLHASLCTRSVQISQILEKKLPNGKGDHIPIVDVSEWFLQHPGYTGNYPVSSSFDQFWSIKLLRTFASTFRCIKFSASLWWIQQHERIRQELLVSSVQIGHQYQQERVWKWPDGEKWNNKWKLHDPERKEKRVSTHMRGPVSISLRFHRQNGICGPSMLSAPTSHVTLGLGRVSP